MKKGIAILLLISLSTGCDKRPFVSLNNNNQNKLIALQPFGDFNNQQLAFIQNGISARFHVPVFILKPAEIPAGYRTTGEDWYSADSLIMHLSALAHDKIVDVVGLTHKDVFTIREYKIHEKNSPAVLYEPKGIFGYGYVSGNSCVISDYRVMSKNQELLNSRLLKIILHEIGHNLGLPHCTTDTCVMFEGDIPTLDKCNGNYCDKCQRILNE